jgi:hypothetical protein
MLKFTEITGLVPFSTATPDFVNWLVGTAQKDK